MNNKIFKILTICTLMIGLFILVSQASLAISISNPVLGQNITEYVNISWTSDNIRVNNYSVYINNTPILTKNNYNEYVPYGDGTSFTAYTCPSFLTLSTANISGYFDNTKQGNFTYQLVYRGADGVFRTRINFLLENGTTITTPDVDNIGTGSTLTYTIQVPYTYFPNNTQKVNTTSFVACRVSGTASQANEKIPYPYNLTWFNESVTKSYNWNTYLSSLSVGTYELKIVEQLINNTINNRSVNININRNSQLNITATTLNGTTINTFSVNITDTTTGIKERYNTTNGIIHLDTIRSRTYTALFDAPGYAYRTHTKITSLAYNNLSTTLYLSNTVVLSIYDETTLQPITQNISVTLTDITNPKILTGSTTTGNITFPNLTTQGDTYEIRFTSINYSTNRYYTILADREVNFIDVYLLPATNMQNVSLCFYDVNGVAISGLSVYEHALSNNGYVLSSNLYTDINGKVVFTFNPNTYYMYNYSTTAYTKRSFILNPPKNSVTLADGCNYDITLTPTTSDTTYERVNVTGESTYNNATSIITFTYTSNDNTISLYSYSVSKYIGGKFVTICTENSALTTHTFTCDVTGYAGTIYIQGVADDRIFYTGIVNIDDSDTLFKNVDDKEAALWSALIVAVIIFAGLLFGPIGVLLSSVAGVLIIFWMGIFTPITITFIAADVVVCIIILIKLRRQ